MRMMMKVQMDAEAGSRAITEPLFGTLKASVQMFPVMDREDLQKGLGQLAQ